MRKRTSSWTVISEQTEQYLQGLLPENEAVFKLMEERALESGFPIIGPLCGQVCYQVARMIGARKIFELGSGFGYSTAWFAKSVHDNGGGSVHHVVWDESLSADAQQYLAELSYGDVVQFTVGEAVETLQAADGLFDLIFNDIDKVGYPDSLAVIEEKLRSGGVLIVDNMLWHGRVFDDEDNAPSTQGIRKLTEMLQDSSKWVVTLLPIRDGLLVAYKQ